MTCCKCYEVIEGEGPVFRIVEDQTGAEIGKLCEPCEWGFWVEGFCTSLVEGE